MDIEQYLNTNEFKTRKELSEETGLTDRCLRNKISDLKQEKAVIYNSQTRGYRLAKDIEKMSDDEIEKEKEAIQHCINDIEARKKVFNMQERTYIAYLKRLEKRHICRI